MVYPERHTPSLEKPWSQNETRRDFIKRLLALGIISSSIVTSSGRQKEIKETLPDIGQRMVMIDFASPAHSDHLPQDSYPSVEETLERLLGERLPSDFELFLEASRHVAQDLVRNPDLATHELIQKYGGSLLFARALKEFSSHGAYVAGRYSTILRYLGVQSTPSLIPIQSFLEPEHVVTSPYIFGKTSFFLNLHYRKFSQQLQKMPQRVVNFSFLFGQFKVEHTYYSQRFDFDAYVQAVEEIKQRYNQEVFVVDKETKQLIGRYPLPPDTQATFEIADDGSIYLSGMDQSGVLRSVDEALPEGRPSKIRQELQKAYENAFTFTALPLDAPKTTIQTPYASGSSEGLSQLCMLALENPEKNVNAAASNYGEDISAQRRTLKQAGVYPENLMMWGQFDRKSRSTNILSDTQLGADVYVDRATWSGLGSSLGCAMGSAVMSYLDAQGLSPEAVREEIKSVCKPQQVHFVRNEGLRRIKPSQQLVGHLVRSVKPPDPEMHVVNVFDLESLEQLKRRYPLAGEK